jgi:UPF0042 nucleotide-binding protein
MDTRTRDFSVKGVMDIYDMMDARDDVAVSIIYIDCDTEVLLRRYSETRRRHPMSPEESPKRGIEAEKDLLQQLRNRADILINTTEMSPHDLRAEINAHFAASGASFLAVNIQSFSYKRGVPRGIDMVLDCRFLRNPYWNESLRGKTGLDTAVKAYVREDARYDVFFRQIVDMATMLLPAYREEGKAHFTIGLGCTGGQHRSVCVTEDVSRALTEAGWQVATRHRELERRAHG